MSDIKQPTDKEIIEHLRGALKRVRNDLAYNIVARMVHSDRNEHLRGVIKECDNDLDKTWTIPF